MSCQIKPLPWSNPCVVSKCRLVIFHPRCWMKGSNGWGGFWREWECCKESFSFLTLPIIFLLLRGKPFC
jgi:hypothetical protein